MLCPSMASIVIIDHQHFMTSYWLIIYFHSAIGRRIHDTDFKILTSEILADLEVFRAQFPPYQRYQLKKVAQTRIFIASL